MLACRQKNISKVESQRVCLNLNGTKNKLINEKKVHLGHNISTIDQNDVNKRNTFGFPFFIHYCNTGNRHL